MPNTEPPDSQHYDPDLIHRFEQEVDRPDGECACWEWLGEQDPAGYGLIAVDRGEPPVRRVVLAHRLAWELARRYPVPAGLMIRHTCDNPSCVRPSHLEIGTAADNQRDMAVRRRGRRSTTGLPYGVCRSGRRFGAHVKIEGRQHWLGTFDTVADASAVAEQERERLYGKVAA